MKLRDEHMRSYIDDEKTAAVMGFLTWRGTDVSPSWVGQHEPATRSDDAELCALASWNRAHYLFYRALVERYVEKNGDIIDVGCGTGARTTMLRRYAKRVLGIDPDGLKIMAAPYINNRQGVEWLMGDLEGWAESTGPERFDYAFCVEVIEHVPFVKQHNFMKTLYDIVKPGGVAMITTPRDEIPDRKHPHVGLWDDDHAGVMAAQIGATIEYFNVHQLDGTGEDPWCDKQDATHYVIVSKKSL